MHVWVAIFHSDLLTIYLSSEKFVTSVCEKIYLECLQLPQSHRALESSPCRATDTDQWLLLMSTLLSVHHGDPAVELARQYLHK